MIETDISGTSAEGPTPIPRSYHDAPTTGRSIVVFAEDEKEPGAVLQSAAGLMNVATLRDFTDGDAFANRDQGEGTIFSELGMAVVADTGSRE